MSHDDVKPENGDPMMNPAADRSSGPARKPLSDAARRALAEAEARRQAAASSQPPREIGGRGGPDPARYGDWEIDGRAIDF